MAKIKYGTVDEPKDITKINQKIREKIKKSKRKDALMRYREQSQYLLALSNSPAWKKDLKGKLIAIRTRIKSEYTKTAKAINTRFKQLGIDKKVDTNI